MNRIDELFHEVWQRPGDIELRVENLPRACLTNLVVRDVPPARRKRIEREARTAQHRLASVRSIAMEKPLRRR